ncbi:MAG: hypothetical protein M1829_006369 [Trizodia sp. TS-e1964]|nr:MAG: hypothetical protein M1829_006369 [Trizodia sp. TS-e1964]
MSTSTTPLTPASRIRGSLLGLACADALGGPAEFHPRGTFPHIDSYQPNQNFNLPPGTWTDDTSMTLCLAQSLIDTGTFHAPTLLSHFIAWYRSGFLSATNECFDIGGATRIALSIWETHAPASPTTFDHAAGQAAVDRALDRKSQCGNGALMRVAPLGLLYAPAQARALARTQARLTHPYATNAEACALYTDLVALCMRGVAKEGLAEHFGRMDIADADLRGRLGGYKSLGDWEGRGQEGIKSSGYVVSTLEAALWCFFSTRGFREGAVRAVNLGDDADTVAAVYGGLAGAYYGCEGELGVPGEWVEGLVKREVIERVVEGLVELEVKLRAGDLESSQGGALNTGTGG